MVTTSIHPVMYYDPATCTTRITDGDCITTLGGTTLSNRAFISSDSIQKDKQKDSKLKNIIAYYYKR